MIENLEVINNHFELAGQFLVVCGKIGDHEREPRATEAMELVVY